MSIRTITKIALMLAVAGSLALPASAQESVDPYTYMSRGKAYVRSGEYKKAISDFNKAIEIDPDNALFYRNRSGAINEALRTEGIHPVVRLFGAFGLGCIPAFLLGALGARGFGAWAEFWSNIRHHADNHYLGPLRVGLQKVFAFDFAAFEAPRSLVERAAAYERLRPLHLVSMVTLSIAWVAGLWKRRGTDAFVLGLGLAFLLSVLSRYYWALWGLFLLLGWPTRGRDDDYWPRLLALGYTPAYCVAAMLSESDFFRFQVATCAVHQVRAHPQPAMV